MKDKPIVCMCGTTVVMEVIDYDIDVKAKGKMHSLHIENFEMPTCPNCGKRWFDIKTDDQVQAALEKKLQE